MEADTFLVELLILIFYTIFSAIVSIFSHFIFHESLNLLIIVFPVVAPWHLLRRNLWGPIFNLFTDTLDRNLGDRRHLVTVELEAKPVETSSIVPVIEYAENVSEDILKGSQEAIENGIHSACLQGKVLR